MGRRPPDEAAGDAIFAPEPAHVREEHEPHAFEELTSDDELEATELRPVRAVEDQLPRLSHILSPGKPQLHWYDPVKKYWRHHIRISVPHEDCRDHLGMCEFALGRHFFLAQ